MKHLMSLFLLMTSMTLVQASEQPAWLDNLTDSEGRTVQYHAEYLDAPADFTAPGYWQELEELERTEVKDPASRPLFIPGRGVIERGPVVHVYKVFKFIPAVMEFRGNVESMVYHKPGCRYYDCASCTQIIVANEEAADLGFRPCGVCKPDEVPGSESP